MTTESLWLFVTGPDLFSTLIGLRRHEATYRKDEGPEERRYWDDPSCYQFATGVM